ncbi:MAG: (E)-4-hydroxy-3-methylbut-2-enyl-diphosphate synthase [Treponema sp.]|nr:(E)-4-hydroxy-3-methylbut-2-enyl-diphosphate synthase [Treponema sp.]
MSTRVVKAGGFDHVEPVFLGGGHPVVIQTMWKDRLSASDLDGKAGEDTVARIEGLKAMGCGLLRFAVPDEAAAELVGRLASMVSLPLSADIHFDYRIALRCLDFPVAKIRINPGNIGGRERVDAVLAKAASRKVPIRIGVNAGSLPRDLRDAVKGGLDRADALVRAAERELAVCDDFGFHDAVVSMKASSMSETVRANRMLASRTGSPLHIGVTEAGPLVAGVVRNTGAILALLGEGIGDTIRVSLSDAMENEVIAGREILAAAGDLSGAVPAGRFGGGGVRIVSCPRCGRHGFDTLGFTGRWLSRLYAMDKNVTVAIMGCAVNGPGEAAHADIGITGAGEKVLIFRHGEVIRTIDASAADAAFGEELEKL